jgi:hypothetical protein
MRGDPAQRREVAALGNVHERRLRAPELLVVTPHPRPDAARVSRIDEPSELRFETVDLAPQGKHLIGERAIAQVGGRTHHDRVNRSWQH